MSVPFEGCYVILEGAKETEQNGSCFYGNYNRMMITLLLLWNLLFFSTTYLTIQRFIFVIFLEFNVAEAIKRSITNKIDTF